MTNPPSQVAQEHRGVAVVRVFRGSEQCQRSRFRKVLQVGKGPVDGVTVLSHSSTWASALEMPRGHSRSTRTRRPSSGFSVNAADLDLVAASAHDCFLVGQGVVSGGQRPV